MSELPTLREMLDHGVHFGHTTARWNPKMKQFIFAARDNVHVIDLGKTREKLDQALKFLQSRVEKGGTVLFVGTKKQAGEITKGAAVRCGMPYVSERWFGGELTNFSVLRNNVKTLENIEQSEASGKLDKFTKKERLKIDERKQKLKILLDGVRTLMSPPNVLFIVDASHEHIAVREGLALNIPIVAIVDTNSNPDSIDYPIPANDDSPRSLSLILDVISETIKEARSSYTQQTTKPEVKEVDKKEVKV